MINLRVATGVIVAGKTALLIDDIERPLAWRKSGQENVLVAEHRELIEHAVW